MKFNFLFGGLLDAGLLATQASAEMVTVPNHSFETDAAGSATVTDWVATQTQDVSIQAFTGGPFGGVDAGDGTKVLRQTIGHAGGSGNVASAAPLGALAAGTYTLTIDFMFYKDTVSDSQLKMPNVFFGLGLVGANSFLGTAGTVTDSLDDGGPDGGSLKTLSYTYNLPSGHALIGQDYGIGIASFSNGTPWEQLVMDNVRLDFEAAVVPEPASLLLVGLGLGGVLVTRRRKA